MKIHVMFVAVGLALLVSGMELGLVAAQVAAGGDKRAVLGTDYKITGHIEPRPGQSFPQSWGRLVNYAVVGYGGTISEQQFVFEAQDGTIRIIKTDLNWNADKVDDAEVITIGRN